MRKVRAFLFLRKKLKFIETNLQQTAKNVQAMIQRLARDGLS